MKGDGGMNDERYHFLHKRHSDGEWEWINQGGFAEIQRVFDHRRSYMNEPCADPSHYHVIPQSAACKVRVRTDPPEEFLL